MNNLVNDVLVHLAWFINSPSDYRAAWLSCKQIARACANPIARNRALNRFSFRYLGQLNHVGIAPRVNISVRPSKIEKVTNLEQAIHSCSPPYMVVDKCLPNGQAHGHVTFVMSSLASLELNTCFGKQHTPPVYTAKTYKGSVIQTCTLHECKTLGDNHFSACVEHRGQSDAEHVWHNFEVRDGCIIKNVLEWSNCVASALTVNLIWKNMGWKYTCNSIGIVSVAFGLQQIMLYDLINYDKSEMIIKQ